MSIFQQGSPWTSPGRLYSAKEPTVSYRGKWSHPLSDLPLKEVITSWYLCTQGHAVPLFTADIQEIKEWCQHNIQGAWVQSEKLITDEVFREELTHRIREGDLSASSKPMSFDIEKVTVQAKSRRLKAQWGFEMTQPAPQPVAHHSVDIEQEIMNALSMEIQNEIDNEVVSHLGNWASVGKQAIARTNPKWFFAFADPREATLFKLTWGGE